MNIENNVLSILQNIEGNQDLREGLKDTPKRVSKMYNEIFSGYNEDPSKYLERVFTTNDVQSDFNINEDEIKYKDGMVIVKDISFFSHCEHHMVPFYGKIHIGYIPKNKVVGLSKLVRVANAYAKRLQVQERLGKQIADCIYNKLDTLGVIVVIEAVHLCMVMRGVQNSTASTTTSVVRGCFQDIKAREEFMSLIKGN